MKILSAAVGALALLLTSNAALAQSRRVEVTAWGSWVHPTQDQTFDADFGTSLKFDDGGGAGVTVNIPVLDFLSVEVGGFWWRSIGSIEYQGAKIADIGALDRYPVLLELQLHPLKAGSRVDPYIGGGGAYVFFSKLRSGDLQQIGVGAVDVKSKLGFIGNAGVAFGVTDAFSLVLDGRYLVVKPNSRGDATGNELELKANTIALSGGLRFRF
jgi:outer membrane protein W